MQRFMGVMVVVMALASAQALAQAAARPAGKSSSSFEKSGFSKNGNSFARERGLGKPVSSAPSNDIKAFYGQQTGASGSSYGGVPQSPAMESSDR